MTPAARWRMPSFGAPKAADEAAARAAVLEAARAEAHAAGHAAGERAGREAARQHEEREAAVRAAAFAKLSGRLQALIDGLDVALADACVVIAAEIARSVTFELSTSRGDLLTELVRAAIGVLGDGVAGADLRVHPLDAALIGAGAGTPRAGTPHVVADALLERGHIVLSTADQQVDIDIEARLRAAIAEVGSRIDRLARASELVQTRSDGEPR